MKVLKWIAKAVIVAGIILLFGTAGASDVDAICFDMAVVRAFLAMAMVGIGLVACCLIDKKEDEQ